MQQFDNRIDLYINKAQPFARPILEYLREIIHEATPLITETMKWSHPFFDYKGPVCHMMAFKQHCGFGFWKAGLLGLESAEEGESSAGSFGRITKIEDLPAREILIDLIQKAITLNENDVKAPPRKKQPLLKPVCWLSPIIFWKHYQRTLWREKTSIISVRRKKKNTLNGSSMLKLRPPVKNAWNKPSNGSARENRGTGSIKASDY